MTFRSDAASAAIAANQQAAADAQALAAVQAQTQAGAQERSAAQTQALEAERDALALAMAFQVKGHEVRVGEVLRVFAYVLGCVHARGAGRCAGFVRLIRGAHARRRIWHGRGTRLIDRQI
ncbi:hypothetical protein ABIA33_005818 [Streptacidiphilus sp. MAP12-16]